MRVAQKIVLASTNRAKLNEFQELFKKLAPEISLVPAHELLKNPEKLQAVENSDNYLDHAIAKARLVNHGCHYPSLGDDSGLEVMALDGQPGVFSHRYAPDPKGVSQNTANRALVLFKMKNQVNRQARLICTLALVMEGLMLYTTGILEGTLSESPQGAMGFGYDSIFIPAGSKLTLAEYTLEEKNNLSHRFQALQSLLFKLKQLNVTLAKP